MSFRLIALDVDGTLLDDRHRLSPRVREAVRSAAAGGAEVVLCTGRGGSSALPVLEELGLHGTMIIHNGASVVDSRTRRLLHESAIPQEQAEPYLAYCRERGLHFDMNTAFELYVERLTDEIAAMYAPFYCQPLLRRPEEGLPAGVVKLGVFGPGTDIDRLEADWRGWPLHYVRSGDGFVDVHLAGVNKGRALERLAELRGIGREQVLAIGNYYNDLEMLAFAGTGVAVANSPADVRAAADEVTLSNNEDGVAAALERLVLAARG